MQVTDGVSTRANKFDGAGRLVWTSLTTPHGTQPPQTSTTYYLPSTVLGGLAAAELNATGQKTKGYIYAGRRKLAEAADAVVTWSHEEPVTGSGGNSGFNMDGTTYFNWRAEFNADGVNVGIRAPADVEPPDFPDRILQFSSYGYGPGCSAGNPTCPACYLDGVKQNCAQVAQLMELGVAQQCPHNDCGPHTMTVTGRTADGRLVGSSTFIVTPGSPGWDGSLDGTYRTGSAFSSQFNFNDSSSMRALVAAVGIYPSLYGSSYMEFFERVGGGGTGSQLFAHAPQNPTPFTKEETNSLRDALKDTLKGKCAEFLDAFSKRISTSTNSARNLMDVFNDVSQQGGFFHIYHGLGFSLGNIHGSPGDARIGLSNSFDAVTLVLITIHELFHHGGSSAGFSHNAMGAGAWDVGQQQGLLDGLKNTNTPGPPKRGNDDVSTNYNATLFDNILRAACGPK